MVKASRYILVLIGVMVAAIVLPDQFWTVFREGHRTPNVMYSQVIDDFIIVKSGEEGTMRVDPDGNVYTADEVEQLLPLLFFRQLSADGNMPESIRGVPTDHAIISRHRGTYTFMPRNINTPKPVLLPLLESQSGRVNLSLPEDVFRLKNSIEFVVAETNAVDKEKSKLFNDALAAAGFQFPARLIAGIPTVMKSRDEGYFIKDSSGNLAHLKMIRGEPYVRHISVPEHINIVHMECVDMRTEELYAYLYTDNNEVYMLLEGAYYLQQLPVDGFDRQTDRLRVRHDMFGKTISVIGDHYLKAIRIDDAYQVVGTYETSWEPRRHRSDYRLFSWFFPFELSMETPDSRFIGFYFSFAHGFGWLIIHLFLVGVSVYLLKRKNSCLRKHGIDLLLVLLTGIFGFTATRVFPNKFYD